MTQYGLTERFAALAAEDGCPVGRVLSQSRDLYRVINEAGEVLAKVSGKLRHETVTVSDFPAVGDFVLLDLPSSAEGQGVIQGFLPRESVFIRKAGGTAHEEQVVAANIDTLFICMSLNNDFNLRRLEHYLAIAWDSGATPVIVLTKADLCDDVEDKLLRVQLVAMGADVLVTSATEADGYQQIAAYIRPGQTIAFIGSFGVGKSTLINRLLGDEKLKTKGLRNDDKGRHTTTRRELILLPGGGMVIDTPGMRELGLWDVTTGLDKTFADVEELATLCRFRDCSHMQEPGCAVQAAIENGELSAERLQSWQKLKTETAYALDAEGYLAAKEKKFRDIAVLNKALRKK